MDPSDGAGEALKRAIVPPNRPVKAAVKMSEVLEMFIFVISWLSQSSQW